MSAEVQSFSPEQIRYQKLFDVKPRGVQFSVIEGEAGGIEKAGANAIALGAGLAVDLIESHAVHHLEHATFGKWMHDLKEDPITNESKIKEMKGAFGAFKFAEEYVSDNAYSLLMNSWLRKATGVEDAKYASEASTFASEWMNAIAQVWLNSRVFGLVEKDLTSKKPITNEKGEMSPITKLNGWVILAHPMENFINPVTVEASVRIFEQVPLVGNAVTWGKEKLNHALEHSSNFKYGNAIAAKAVTGYHIAKNIMK
ncbi:MAG: hypothetical protein AAB492_03725 [Patescibacteria group bacterium]